MPDCTNHLFTFTPRALGRRSALCAAGMTRLDRSNELLSCDMQHRSLHIRRRARAMRVSQRMYIRRNNIANSAENCRLSLGNKPQECLTKQKTVLLS